MYFFYLDRYILVNMCSIILTRLNNYTYLTASKYKCTIKIFLHIVHGFILMSMCEVLSVLFLLSFCVQLILQGVSEGWFRKILYIRSIMMFLCNVKYSFNLRKMYLYVTTYIFCYTESSRNASHIIVRH